MVGRSKGKEGRELSSHINMSSKQARHGGRTTVMMSAAKQKVESENTRGRRRNSWPPFC